MARRPPRPVAAIEDIFSACDKIPARFARRGAHTDHMGQRDRRRRVETTDFTDDKVPEPSTIPGRCARIKQIRSLPGAARVAGRRVGRRPQGGPHLGRRCGLWSGRAARALGCVT